MNIITIFIAMVLKRESAQTAKYTDGIAAPSVEVILSGSLQRGLASKTTHIVRTLKPS